jgi:hypothetical protein
MRLKACLTAPHNAEVIQLSARSGLLQVWSVMNVALTR